MIFLLLFVADTMEIPLDSFLHMQDRLEKIPGWANAVDWNRYAVRHATKDSMIQCSITAHRAWTREIDLWEKDRQFYRLRYFVNYLIRERNIQYATVEYDCR